MDFNPYALATSLSDDDAALEAWQKGRVVTEASRIPRGNFFLKDVESHLPYREVVTEESFDLTEVMMDANQIVLLKVALFSFSAILNRTDDVLFHSGWVVNRVQMNLQSWRSVNIRAGTEVGQEGSALTSGSLSAHTPCPMFLRTFDKQVSVIPSGNSVLEHDLDLVIWIHLSSGSIYLLDSYRIGLRHQIFANLVIYKHWQRSFVRARHITPLSYLTAVRHN
jgi:hypothetical protein